MPDYYLRMSQEEILDVELAIILALGNHRKEGQFKTNLKAVKSRIADIQEESERCLEQFC